MAPHYLHVLWVWQVCVGRGRVGVVVGVAGLVVQAEVLVEVVEDGQRLEAVSKCAGYRRPWIQTG